MLRSHPQPRRSSPLRSGRGAGAEPPRPPPPRAPRGSHAPRPRNFAARVREGGSSSAPRPPPAPRWARAVFLTQEKWQILSTSLIWRQNPSFFFFKYKLIFYLFIYFLKGWRSRPVYACAQRGEGERAGGGGGGERECVRV